MPVAAPKPCKQAGCRALVTAGAYCETHKKPAWTKRIDAPNRLRGRKLQALRKSIFRDAPLCAVCEAHGRLAQATELDHIVPLYQGGTDQRDNLQGLCAECHRARTQKEAWEARMGGVKKSVTF